MPQLKIHQYRYENITSRMNNVFSPLLRSPSKLPRTPHAISYTVSWDSHFPVLFRNCLGVPAASAEYQTLPVLSSPLLVVVVSAILPVSDRHCHFSGARLNWKARVWNVAKRCVVSCIPATGTSTCVPAITSSVCAGKCLAWPRSCVAYSWRYAMKGSLRGWLAHNSVRRFCRTGRSVAVFTGRSAV
jgi:hypothetical protein